jgi:hypothetical protein
VSSEEWTAGWSVIDNAKYQSLGDDERNRLLIFMASHSLLTLADYEIPKRVANDSVSACVRYMEDRSVDARSISIYLNHTDSNLDLSAQYSFVGADIAAYDALDIVCFATGAVARTAYLRQRLSSPPEPVILATPNVTVEALEIFRRMLRMGIVSAD